MYNDFGQAIQTFQAHDGEVNPLSTPSVQMGYADGSDNTTRQVSLTYPNGRVLTYAYGTTGGIDDAVSRIVSIIDDDSTHLVDYEYLGQNTFVTSTSPEPGIQWTLVGDDDDPDTGDIYTGLDRFGRVKDNRWHKAGTDLDRIKYGYDRASNRIWRENPVATANSAAFDELYTYDGIHRLKDMARGTLNLGHTALTTKTFGETWTLDATGNWTTYTRDDDGDSTDDLVQTRTANEVNEITAITNSVGSTWAQPTYSPAGNMATIPQGNDPTQSYTATYDAWNRLTKLVDDDTTNTVSEYRYDGRRFQIIQSEYTEGVLDVTKHQYYTNGWQNIEQRDDTDTTPAQHYVWGRRYIDDCVLRDRSVEATLDEQLYALQDANWNVSGLADVSGLLINRFEYGTYGSPISLTASFSSSVNDRYWTILYCGYIWDTEPRIYYVRHRTLHCSLGAWIQRDPLGYIDGTSVYSSYGVLSHTDAFGMAVGPFGGELPKTFDDWFGKPDNECKRVTLKEFLDWYKKSGGAISDKQKWALWEGGCVGLASIAGGCGSDNLYPFSVDGIIRSPGFPSPERRPDTECFLTEKEASDRKCAPGESSFVFSKQGKWRQGAAPVPNSDGLIPNESVMGNDGRGDFYYMTKSAGYYWHINHGAARPGRNLPVNPPYRPDGFGGFEYLPDWSPEEDPANPQIITICKNPPDLSGYPDRMWCSTCKKCK